MTSQSREGLTGLAELDRLAEAAGLTSRTHARDDGFDPSAAVHGGGAQLGWIWHGISPDRPVDGGGSRVHAEWTYTGATPTRDKIMLALLQRFPLRRMIARGWVKALDRHTVEWSVGSHRSPL